MLVLSLTNPYKSAFKKLKIAKKNGIIVKRFCLVEESTTVSIDFSYPFVHWTSLAFGTAIQGLSECFRYLKFLGI